MRRPIPSCKTCHKRPRAPAFEACDQCRSAAYSLAARTRWRRRRAKQPAHAPIDAGPNPYTPADLDALMAAADAAGAKAMSAASKIKP